MLLSYDDLLKSSLALLAGGTGAAAVTGFFAWMRTRTRQPASMQTSQAAFQAALSEQSRTFTDTLLEVVDRQQRRIDEQARRIDVLDQAYQQAHGENLQMRQIIRSLVHLLKARGVELPDDLDVAAVLQTDDDGVAKMTAVDFRTAARPAKPPPKS